MARQLKEQIYGLVDPSRSILLFIIGTAALSLGFQAMYDFANEITNDKGGYWLAIASVLLALVVVYISWKRQTTIGRVDIEEEYQPSKRKGLIILAGPTEASTPHAIEYHLGTLEYCWIIATSDSINTASAMADRYRTEVPLIFWGEPNYIVDPDQIQDTYDLVYRIAEEEAKEIGISSTQIIADITGGTKPMSTGMGMACLARDMDMEYMKALRDIDGKIIKGSIPEPIRIDTTLFPSSHLLT